MALHERGGRPEVHLEPVLGHDAPERLLVGRALVVGREQRCYLSEVLLEAGGGDDLQRTHRRVARVPESVRDAPGLEDEVARPGDEDLIPDLGANLSLQHVGVLVLVPVVRVHRRGEYAGPYRVLDEREPTSVLDAPIMNRTPSPPIDTISPSSADSTIRGRELSAPVMVDLLLRAPSLAD